MVLQSVVAVPAVSLWSRAQQLWSSAAPLCTHPTLLPSSKSPVQATLDAERARLRALVKRQLAEAAMLAEADEGAGLVAQAGTAAVGGAAQVCGWVCKLCCAAGLKGRAMFWEWLDMWGWAGGRQWMLGGC